MVKPAEIIAVAAALGMGIPPLEPRRTLGWLGYNLPVAQSDSDAAICARLKAFFAARPRPWRTGSRFSNRNIRRAAALARQARERAAYQRKLADGIPF